jgi:hydroxymethylglutaryl-CoA lyase
LQRWLKKMRVELVDVAARDGLQNEARTLPVAAKLELIGKIAAAGIRRIEAGACVAADKVPQMKDSAEVFRALTPRADVRYCALCPNMRGLKDALAPAIGEIAVFVAASDSFNRANINCDTAGGLRRAAEVAAAAKTSGRRVRGYISTVISCPFEGEIAPVKVAKIALQLMESGCDEISLGDTIGAATPRAIKRLIKEARAAVPVKSLAAHFHDTYGQALANIRAALDCGVRIVDCAVGGLGGCPFAPGASGNAAAEDVAYLLQGEGALGDVDLEKLIKAGDYACRKLGRSNQTKAAAAIRARKRRGR